MSEKPSMPEFRVYVLKDLLINPPPGPPAELTTGLGAALLALLVPKLIEAAITGVATALKKAGEKETKQLTAGEFCDLYVSVDKKDKEGKEIQLLSLNPRLGCVLGVWFQDPPPKNPPPDDEVVQKLKKKEFVPPKALVGGVFEAAIRRAPDDTAFFLDTRHFSVRHFVGDRNKDERDYVVTLAITGPDSSSDGSTFALGTIDLGTMTKGKNLVPPGQPFDKFPRFWSNLMPWPTMSAASAAAWGRDVASGTAKDRTYMPVTFSVTVSETADGNKFLLALGEALGGVATEAAGEISKRILPAEIEKTAAEEAAGAEKLYQEELQAKKEFLEAEKASKADPTNDVLKVALEIAKRKLEWQTKLRKAAGLPDR
jgi:hypothetical protein